MDTHKSKTRIVYPHGRSRMLRRLPQGGPLSMAMLPGSMIYKWLSGFVRSARLGRGRDGRDARAARRVYGADTAGAARDVCTVISIGNIEVGGNGKTPMAMNLVNRLADAGYRPVYISRGFRSEAERSKTVTVVVPESSGSPLAMPPGVRMLGADGGQPVTARIGDEGAMVMMRCPAVPLVFCRDRARAISTAREMFEPTHVVLDDAFQTWGVARDVDVVLLDARAPVGNGRLLPAGTLREGPEALKRAHAVGFNNIDAADGDLSEKSRWVSQYAGWAVPVFGIQRSLTFIDTGSRRAGASVGGSVAAMSSIGRPDRFEQSLREHGVDLPLSIRFPDHHRYEPDDMRLAESLLARKRIDQLVVTEKDWVKLREIGPPATHVWVARLELEIVGEDPFQICEKPQAVPTAFL